MQTGEGGPDDLRLKYTTRRDRVVKGMNVVTAGTTSRSARLESPYPPGIPIGEVTRVDDAGTDTQQVHVKPYADLRRLEFVAGPDPPREREPAVIAAPLQLAWRLVLLGRRRRARADRGRLADRDPRHQRRPHAARRRERRPAAPARCRAPRFGFGIGLFLDLALVQTVGMSSLLFLTIGYGAGRLRELRDPQGAARPGRRRRRRDAASPSSASR